MLFERWLYHVMIRCLIIAVCGLWLQTPQAQGLSDDVVYVTPLADQQSVPPNTDNSDTPEAIIIALTEPLQRVDLALLTTTSASYSQLAFALAQIRAPPVMTL